MESENAALQSYFLKEDCKFSPDSASQFILDVNSLMLSVCVFTEVNCCLVLIALPVLR